MIEAKKDDIRGIELSGRDVPKPPIDPEGKVLESLVDFLNKSSGENIFEEQDRTEKSDSENSNPK